MQGFDWSAVRVADVRHTRRIAETRVCPCPCPDHPHTSPPTTVSCLFIQLITQEAVGINRFNLCWRAVVTKACSSTQHSSGGGCCSCSGTYSRKNDPAEDTGSTPTHTPHTHPLHITPPPPQDAHRINGRRRHCCFGPQGHLQAAARLRPLPAGAFQFLLRETRRHEREP